MASSNESFARGAFAGFMGGACQTFAGQPFDTVKVRMQTGGPTQGSLIKCATRTIQTEGFRGLYHGTVPALMFGLIENTFAFGVNEQLKRVFLRNDFGAAGGGELSTPVLAACGAASGFAHCIFSCPTEVVKCRVQVVGSQFRGPLHCTTETLRKEGVAGLYSGFWPFVFREVPFYLFFFASYELIASKMQRFGAAAGAVSRQRDELSNFEVLFAGGFAGCIGWTCVMPSDSIKTKIQTRGPGGPSFVGTFMEVFKAAGPRGLFEGWSAAMLRAFPANAALFFGFETTRRAMAYLDSK